MKLCAMFRVEHVWATPFPLPPPPSPTLSSPVSHRCPHPKCLTLENINLFLFASPPGCLVGILSLGVFSVFVAAAPTSQAASTLCHTYIAMGRGSALLSHSIQLIQLGLYRFFMCILPRHCHTIPVARSQLPIPRASQTPRQSTLNSPSPPAAPECLIYLWLGYGGEFFA